jgi:hypothetical protein
VGSSTPFTVSSVAGVGDVLGAVLAVVDGVVVAVPRGSGRAAYLVELFHRLPGISSLLSIWLAISQMSSMMTA